MYADELLIQTIQSPQLALQQKPSIPLFWTTAAIYARQDLIQGLVQGEDSLQTGLACPMRGAYGHQGGSEAEARFC